MNELERLKAKKEELKKDKKIMSYEEQIQALFNQPIKRIKANTYLRRERQAKKENREIKNVIKASYLY